MGWGGGGGVVYHTIVTYDNLVAAEAQGEPTACAGPQSSQIVAVSEGRCTHNHMPRRVWEFAELR
jgi:hypothetical protein